MTMKVILPLAGLGRRMRPHTWSKPKPLLNVAGKPVLAHVLDKLSPLEIEEVIFIIGWLGDQIKEYVSANYDFAARYIVQEELKGQAHAIYLAKEHLDGPCLIIFVDTLFEANITNLEERPEDVLLYVQEVKDPRRFGVVVEKEGRVVQLIEKPSGFEHRKAIVGVYYIREGKELVKAIEYLLEHDIRTKGEYYLTDALQVMIERGAFVGTEPVSVWEDCGKPETVLHTNRYLLEHGHAHSRELEGSTIIPPVYIAETAKVESSIIGPYATVCEGVHLKGAIVRDTIIEEDSRIENALLEHSLIGRRVTIRGFSGQLNVGDDCTIELNEENRSKEPRE